MSRRQQGFSRGDFDTSFPLDDRFLELRGSLDPLHYYAAVGVYWTVVAATWREADRKPGCRTAPDAPDQLADLSRVGLLDAKQSVRMSSFRRWIGRALDSRKGDAERQARKRAGMSRVTPPESPVRPSVSIPRARSGRVGSDGSDGPGDSPSVVVGGPGGGDVDDGRRDLEAWMLVKFRAPTDGQRRFLDSYCRTFDVTGPERAERIILSNPADPIAALKADLDGFRQERLGEAEAAEAAARRRPARRAGGMTSLQRELAAAFREQDEAREAREQARLEAIAEAQAAGGRP